MFLPFKLSVGLSIEPRAVTPPSSSHPPRAEHGDCMNMAFILKSLSGLPVS